MYTLVTAARRFRSGSSRLRLPSTISTKSTSCGLCPNTEAQRFASSSDRSASAARTTAPCWVELVLDPPPPTIEQPKTPHVLAANRRRSDAMITPEDHRTGRAVARTSPRKDETQRARHSLTISSEDPMWSNGFFESAGSKALNVPP